MLSKSSIQFSVDGQGCVPSLLFDLRPNYGGIMKIMLTSFKRSCAHTVVFSAPDLAAGHCWPTSLPETPGHSQAGLGQSLVGHCSFLLGPGAHKFCVCVCVFVLSKSLFPQSCVRSVIKSHWPPKSNSLGVLSPFARSPGWEICCGSSSLSSVQALSCLTLCDTMEYSPLGSSAYGIFQARILEWVAISFSRES